MTLYLLDTNIISDLVRNPDGAVAGTLESLVEHEVCTSIIVAAELRFGVEKKGAFRLAIQLEALLEDIQVAAFESPAERSYATVRAQLERDGTPISGNDMLIAAHAITLDAVLVTANVREFQRVEGLKVENWLS